MNSLPAVLRAYFQLTKSGIILFTLVTALAGYAMSFPVTEELQSEHLLLLLVGLYFATAGSFALNQAQEWRRDSKMHRTRMRPIPQGLVAPWQAYLLAIFFLIFGLGTLLLVSQTSAALTATTVILYNGFYTLYWKRKLAFGAVPGAIPGAMPALIGYGANTSAILEPAALYMFLVMFLWQMPHFWALALRYADDYARGGYPVLPAIVGRSRTLYQIGLYTFTYVGVAVMAPLYLQSNLMYLLLVLPLGLKVIYEFFKYFKSEGENNWLPFFLWTNLSMLVFIGVPVIDKWLLAASAPGRLVF